MALVLDTGVIYAALDPADPDHAACSELVTDTREDLIVPDPVLVELDQLLGRARDLRSWMRFCGEIADGVFALYPLDTALLVSAVAIQERFGDQPIGFVDAVVLATCDALGETKVATLDRRHFGVLRTEDGRALTMLPSV